MTNKLVIILLILFLSSCSIIQKDEQKSATSDNTNITYYANKTVNTLVVPPDLTNPISKDAFKLSQYIDGIEENVISFSDNKDEKIINGFKTPINIIVKKSGYNRWLIVDKKADYIWDEVNKFLEENGLLVEQSNKKIGFLETGFSERHVKIPDESLGLVRSMLAKAIRAKYTLPIVDKYRIRIEPVVEDDEKSEVYLSMSSMEEVVNIRGKEEKSIVWQTSIQNKDLEIYMLYRLMLFLGEDKLIAQTKIDNAQEVGRKIKVSLGKSADGYAKLTFNLNRYDTWQNIGLVFDQLNINIDDRDIGEGSFYINIVHAQDKGIFSRIFGKDDIIKSFQIIVQQLKENSTDVYFNDISGKNEQATIDFSHEFLGNIAKQFE